MSEATDTTDTTDTINTINTINTEWMSRDPETIPLDQLDLMNPQLFHNDYHVKVFERLRRESPVHFQKDHEEVGSLNVTRYEDIMAVDTNHDCFSSDGSIVATDVDEEFPLPMFIAMDPA
ncbi:MAG: hypothetical protein ACNYPE_05310 [Candidatus Azotimanducaceae bacterium WSBS_2022_MAG_OTU7]